MNHSRNRGTDITSPTRGGLRIQCGLYINLYPEQTEYYNNEGVNYARKH